MKLKNKVFANSLFSTSLQKLNKLNNIPMESFIEILRLNKKLEENQIIYNEARTSIIKKYGKEEKNGNWIIPPNSSEKVIENVNEEFNELIEIEFETGTDKIVFSKRFLGEFGLTPSDVLVLEDIFEIPEIDIPKKKKK